MRNDVARSAHNPGMNRRKFIVLAGGSVLMTAARLEANHHFVSADPLVVESDLQSFEGRYTPLRDFYVRNHYQRPQGLPAASLRIEGEIRTPRQLTLRDLSSLPFERQGAVLECAGNRLGIAALASNGLWEGWRLRDVFSCVSPRASARYVHLYGADGYARSVPIERAFTSGFLVTRLNGQPLEANHGFPWRALFVGWYGMDSVKWLERIEFAPNPLPGRDNAYLELKEKSSGKIERGPLPRVMVQSVITSPGERSILRIGKAVIRGLAWSGAGRISSVRASADGGASWRDATLGTGAPYEWATWRVVFELSRRGVVEFACRATDVTGATQPFRRDPARLDGYADNSIQRVRCVVV